MKSFKKILNQEHSGFAITLEVLSTLAIITTFLVLILYTVRVLNVERYMNTIVTSSAIQASRYGGNNTNAFKNYVSNDTISHYYQLYLNSDCGVNSSFNFNPILTITPPDKISYDYQNVQIKLTYTLPNPFDSYSKISNGRSTYDASPLTKTQTISFSMKSLMRKGDLL